MVRKDGDRFWAIPGGRVEEEETVQETLERELHEELGVRLAGPGFRVLGTFTDRAADTGEEFSLMLCTGEIVGTPAPSAEIGECMWFDGTLPHGTLPPMFVHHVQPALAKLIGWQPRTAGDERQ